MSSPNRDLLIARVISGYSKLKFHFYTPHILYVKRPSADHVYIAQELYQEVYDLAYAEGVFSDEEALSFWPGSAEKDLVKYTKDIEDFKVRMLELSARPTDANRVRSALRQAEARHGELHSQKYRFAYATCSGYANLLRSKFLLGVSLYKDLTTPIFVHEADFWMADSRFIDVVSATYLQNKIPEEDYRAIARAEPWRSLWSTGKGRDLFGHCVTEYSEEQRELSLWSSLYDNILEHPDCPPERVLTDDDMMDGWLILQRRKRLSAIAEKSIGAGLSEKAKNSQEVFIPAESLEHAREIESLNDPQAARIKQQRLALLHKKGKVSELEMPDTKKRLMMEATQKLSQAFKK